MIYRLSADDSPAREVLHSITHVSYHIAGYYLIVEITAHCQNGTSFTKQHINVQFNTHMCPYTHLRTVCFYKAWSLILWTMYLDRRHWSVIHVCRVCPYVWCCVTKWWHVIAHVEWNKKLWNATMSITSMSLGSHIMSPNYRATLFSFNA